MWIPDFWVVGGAYFRALGNFPDSEKWVQCSERSKKWFGALTLRSFSHLPAFIACFLVSESSEDYETIFLHIFHQIIHNFEKNIYIFHKKNHFCIFFFECYEKYNLLKFQKKKFRWCILPWFSWGLVIKPFSYT